MDGVVAFSLYGLDPEDIYYEGAIENARMYAELMPSCTPVFYIGASVPLTLKDQLRDANPRTIIFSPDEPEDCRSSAWRFRAVTLDGYDYYIFRDVDSRPIRRELVAVDEWLVSDKQFHVMRDHKRHGAQILAGLWGVKKNASHSIQRRMAAQLPRKEAKDRFADQRMLASKIWRQARRDIITHIDCTWMFENISLIREFTVPSEDGEFVGEGFYADGKPRYPSHRIEKLHSPGYDALITANARAIPSSRVTFGL